MWSLDIKIMLAGKLLHPPTEAKELKASRSPEVLCPCLNESTHSYSQWGLCWSNLFCFWHETGHITLFGRCSCNEGVYMVCNDVWMDDGVPEAYINAKTPDFPPENCFEMRWSMFFTLPVSDLNDVAVHQYRPVQIYYRIGWKYIYIFYICIYTHTHSGISLL